MHSARVFWGGARTRKLVCFRFFNVPQGLYKVEELTPPSLSPVPEPSRRLAGVPPENQILLCGGPPYKPLRSHLPPGVAVAVSATAAAAANNDTDTTTTTTNDNDNTGLTGSYNAATATASASDSASATVDAFDVKTPARIKSKTNVYLFDWRTLAPERSAPASPASAAASAAATAAAAAAAAAAAGADATSSAPSGFAEDGGVSPSSGSPQALLPPEGAAAAAAAEVAAVAAAAAAEVAEATLRDAEAVEVAEFAGAAEVRLPTVPGAAPSPLPSAEGSVLLAVRDYFRRLLLGFKLLGFDNRTRLMFCESFEIHLTNAKRAKFYAIFP